MIYKKYNAYKINEVDMNNSEIKKAQKESLGMLWAAYDYKKADIAKDLGLTRSVVQGWFNRGRISASAAIKIEKKELAIRAGITKEILRPDVNEWFGV